MDQTTGTTVVSGFTYNPAGGTTSRTLGNGAAETFAYNRLQETAITATLSSVTSMNFTYKYGSSTTNTGGYSPEPMPFSPSTVVNGRLECHSPSIDMCTPRMTL